MELVLQKQLEKILLDKRVNNNFLLQIHTNYQIQLV